jgi:hypothetical protein
MSIHIAILVVKDSGVGVFLGTTNKAAFFGVNRYRQPHSTHGLGMGVGFCISTTIHGEPIPSAIPWVVKVLNGSPFLSRPYNTPYG